MAWNIIPKETLALVLTCQFDKKNRKYFFKIHLWATAFVLLQQRKQLPWWTLKTINIKSDSTMIPSKINKDQIPIILSNGIKKN